MRGISLINAGVVVLLIALVVLAIYPDRQRPQESSTPAEGVAASATTASAETESSATGMPADAVPGRPVAEHAADSAAVPAGVAVQQTPPAAGATSTDTQPPAAAAAPAKTPPAAQLQEPLQFPEWPQPKLALVVTGEQLGYFEPCGCTANQLGGMSRRAGLFARLQSLGWAVRGIDAGSVSRRSVRQAQVKFETILAAMRELQYIGMALGPEELRLDPGYLISQHATEGALPLRFLCANLTFYGVADLGTPVPLTVFEHEGLKVGITAVLGTARRREVIPDRTPEEAAAADMQWTEPLAALQAVTEKLDAEGVDLRILLSQAAIDETREFARQFPGFDVIVQVPSFGDGRREPELIGNVRLLQVGTQGKHAGVLGIYPDDAEQPVRFELVTLSGAQFSGSPRMVELMQGYQERLQDEQIVLAESPVTHPSGATFVGAAKCGECHTQALEIWQNTAHAHAFESLDPAHGRPGHERLEGVSRTFDPECLSCHVTGWDPQEYVRFRSGFINTTFAQSDDEKLLEQLLAGNQCENCHGPGSRHVELIEAGNTEAATAEVRVTLQQAREKGCVKCHDGENSPEFDFDAYWKQVQHYGKD